MIEIGKINNLKISRIDSKGVFLDGEENGEFFLPRRDVPQNAKSGDSIKVFLYPDSERRIVATIKKPFGMAGQFAWLKVISVNSVGVFMDWGLKKDLMVPFSEQKQSLKDGRSYIVYIMFDTKSNRIIASTKLHKYFKTDVPVYEEGVETDLLVYGQTETFYKVIVDNGYKGVLYKNEVFQNLFLGQQVKGYVKKVREDGKVDLLFHKPGYGKVSGLSKIILDKLEREGGYLPVTDKSSPEVIYNLFGESKSTFKNALGLLYKKRIISIEKEGIRINKKSETAG